MSDSFLWGRAISPQHRLVRLGRPGNRYPRESPWPDEPPTTPWAVYLAKRHLYKSLALDFDSRGEQGASHDAMDAYLLLQSLGFTPALADSGGGGRHVFALLPELTHAQSVHPLVKALGRMWKTLDIAPMVNATTGCIRPPGAPHESGGRSVVLIGDIAAFSGGPVPESFERLHDAVERYVPVPPPNIQTADPEASSAIPARVERLLVEGDAEGALPSRSEVIQTIAFAYFTAGRSFEDFLTAVLNPANRGGEKAQEMGGKEARAYLQRAYSQAASFTPNPSVVRRQIRQPSDLASIGNIRWSGVAGATDRACLEALLHKALRLSSDIFGMSVRELGELAGVRKDTAARSLRRLRSEGLIEQVQPSLRGKPAIWRLMVQVEDSQIHMGRGHVLTVPRSPRPIPDAFRWSGLGPNGYRVWKATRELHQPGVIAENLGIHPSTVRRRLAQLADVGLVERRDQDRGWYYIYRDLRAVAEDLGVDGSLAQQKEYHARERQYRGQSEINPTGTGLVLTAQ